MTNEPPTGDGEELVDADLPTTSSAPDPVHPPTTPPPEPEPSALDVFDKRLRQAETNLDAQAEATARERFEATVRAIREEYGPDVDAEALARHDLGLPEPGADLPPPPDQPFPEQRPFEDGRVREALETTISDESRVRQAEADRALAAEYQPPPVTDDRVRQAVETEISAESRARQAAADRERSANISQEDWNALQPNAPMLYDVGPLEQARNFPASGMKLGRSNIIRLLTVAALAAGGIASAFLLGLGPFGGSDAGDGTSLPATDIEATTAATETASSPTTAPTEAVSEAPAIASEPADLTLLSINAFSDGVGDLWLGLELQAPLGLNPDALEFVHGFAVGAALQTDQGYDGFYFSYLDGDTYGEAVFGSPDYPRTSGTFNANFQIAAPELWITDDGQLAIHLLGDAAGNGVDATLFGPDAVVIAGATVVETEGDAALGGFDEYALGPVTAGGNLPLDSWTEWEPQQHPLRLDVPDTSDRS